jgi:hypothetical protein
MALFQPFTPDFEWPQDDLTVPQLGPMPPTDAVNKLVVGREYATYATRLQVAANAGGLTAAGGFTVQMVPVDQSADFWCDHITMLSYASTGGAQGVLDVPVLMVRIRDFRTGADLGFSQTFPAPSTNPANTTVPLPPNLVPVAMFACMPNSGVEAQLAYAGGAPLPDGFRTVGTLVQPFCFTRQGGIEVTWLNMFADGSNTTQDVTLLFSGWKEYEHGS